MVDVEEDLLQDEVAGMSTPGEVEAVYLINNNICTKAVAEVRTTITIVVTIVAKVGDQQPTTTTITTIIISITETAAVPTGTTMMVVATTITTTMVEDQHSGDRQKP